MAVSAKTGSFNLGTGAAASTVSVSGLGFTPKVVLFFWTGLGSNDSTSNSLATSNYKAMGAAAGSSSRWCYGGTSTDAQATSKTSRFGYTDRCIAEISPSADTLTGAADLQSLDSDGFTLVIDDQFVNNLLIHYLALGGDSITDVGLGTFVEPAATGDQAITGVGFQPDGLIIGGIGHTANNAVTANSGFCFGVGASGSTGGSIGSRSRDAQATTVCYGYLRSDRIIGRLSPSGTTSTEGRATLVSMDSDGFTLNWLERTGSYIYYYLALRGGDYTVGDYNSATSNGSTITETIGYRPAAVITAGMMRAQGLSDNGAAEDEQTIGVFTSDTERQSIFFHDVHNLADSNVIVGSSSAYVLHGANTSGTVDWAIDVSAISSTGFTLVQDIAVGSVFLQTYLAIGPGSTNVDATATAARQTLTSSPAALAAAGAATAAATRQALASSPAAASAAGAATAQASRQTLTSSPAAASAAGAATAQASRQTLSASQMPAAASGTAAAAPASLASTTALRPASGEGAATAAAARQTLTSSPAAASAAGAATAAAARQTLTSAIAAPAASGTATAAAARPAQSTSIAPAAARGAGAALASRLSLPLPFRRRVRPSRARQNLRARAARRRQRQRGRR